MKASWSRVLQPGPVKWIGRLLVLSLAAVHTAVAILSRSMNEDGIAYLDLGDAWFRGQWGDVANTTWSPLYALVVGAVVNLVRVSPATEFQIVQLVNFALLVFALGCFEYFWSRLLADHQRVEATASAAATMPESIWWAVGYSLFAWSSLNLIEVWAVTPDMLVAAIVYITAGIWLSAWRRPKEGRRRLVVLGLILAVGYLAKAVIYPLGLVFIAIVGLLLGRNWLPDRRAVTALAVFLVVTTPLVVAVSVAAGYPTFSDVGRFTYLKHVNAMPYPGFEEVAHELGGEILHAPRKIFAEPTVFEFAQPVGGTYPLATDPAYWTRGVEPVVSLRGQANAVASNLVYYFDLFVGTQGGVLTVLALLGVIAVQRGWQPQLRCGSFGLIAWALAALALYVLVRADGRYVAPFVVLLFAGLLAWPRLPESRGARQLLAAIGAAIALWQWLQIGAVNLAEGARLVGFQPGSQDAEFISAAAPVAAPPADNVAIAMALREDGVSPGDQVAFAGYSYSAYWARLARVRIVAEVRPEELGRLWDMTESRLVELDAALGDAGVVAFVATPPLHGQPAARSDWRPLGDTGYLVRYLRGTALTAQAETPPD